MGVYAIIAGGILKMQLQHCDHYDLNNEAKLVISERKRIKILYFIHCNEPIHINCFVLNNKNNNNK